MKNRRATKASKNSKITVRLSKSDREILTGTSALFGMNLARYAEKLLRERAREIRRDNPVIRLSRRDFTAFMKMCREPKKPNAALRRAVKRYQESWKGNAV